MVACGAAHSVLLHADGTAVAFGANDAGQSELPPCPEGCRYVSASAAEEATLLLRDDGVALVVGEDGGHGYKVFPRMPDDGQGGDDGDQRGYVAAVLGGWHAALLRDDGMPVAFGRNADGECSVPDLRGASCVAVAAGRYHTILIMENGEAVAFGRGRDGQCLVPELPVGVHYVSAAGGHAHTVLLRSDGCVVAVGDNSEGQLQIPVLPEGIAYEGVAAGDFHTVLIRSDGVAVAFGADDLGQCMVPELPPGTRYVEAACGRRHSLLLRDDGQAVACGDVRRGQCSVPPLLHGRRYAPCCRPVRVPWTAEGHKEFPPRTRHTVKELLLCQRRHSHQGLSSLGDLLVSRVLPFAIPWRLATDL